MCGSKNLEIKDLKGKSFPWMDFPEVKLNVSLINDGLLTCSLCQNVVMRSGSLEALDNAIEESIRNNLSDKLNTPWTKPIPDYADYLKIIKD